MNPALTLLLTFLPCSVACAADIRAYQLLGHWRCYAGGEMTDIRFFADGTYTGYLQKMKSPGSVPRLHEGYVFKRDGEIFWRFGGRWSLTGNVVSYVYYYSGPGRIPRGTTDSDRITELTVDYYSIETSDGASRKYLRVRPFGPTEG